MGMFHIYVPQSRAGKLYIGQTNNIDRRLLAHNSDEVFSTRNRGPWTLVYSEELGTRGEAMRREKYLKQGAGHRWLKEYLATSGRGVAQR